ncbi:hypothetical protein [Herbiconiux daphne]|uniref:Uncharacterized protein n=1 Tax=Herbiconiux daphne TaxID=2970914 RepID=A0ABT2H6M4_9MICO|nr:hypothetical protein [Herbiconiux daphne]MCS5735572.1 hypothetical protein [Herbiconiux daphne]
MTKSSETLVAAVRDTRAMALPKDFAGSTPPVRIPDPASFDFVLVSTSDQYEYALSVGAQPILITRDFSVTDRRGKLRLRLGKLIEPWRWRRTLLNEGVTELTVPRAGGSASFRIASRLAKVRVIVWRGPIS